MKSPNELYAHYKKAAKIESIMAQLWWDFETYLPAGSGPLREEQLAFCSELYHQTLSNPHFVNACLEIDHTQLSSVDQKQIQKLKKTILLNKALDKDFVARKTKAEFNCQIKWKEARKENNARLVFNSFKELLSIKKEEAQKFKELKDLGYSQKSLYDISFDQYEPGFSSDKLENLFSLLKDKSISWVHEIEEKQQSISHQKIGLFEKNFSKKTCHQLIKDFGFDFDKGRLDESIHPFCGGSTTDVRMTTRFEEPDALNPFLSAIHECGHGLYEQNLPPELHFTPCGGACSLGIHESQSRFLENFIGRSTAYSKYLSKMLDVPSERIYNELNQVKRSLIRVDADEVSYNLHIIIRTFLEKKLFTEELSVEDLESTWNEEYQKCFKISPQSVNEGFMQDTHWFGGAFAYFPTYTIGNLLAAELFNQFKNEFPQWEEHVEKGDLHFIKNFLTTRVHKLAALEDSPSTIKKIIQKELSIDAFENYVKEKY